MKKNRGLSCLILFTLAAVVFSVSGVLAGSDEKVTGIAAGVKLTAETPKGAILHANNPFQLTIKCDGLPAEVKEAKSVSFTCDGLEQKQIPPTVKGAKVNNGVIEMPVMIGSDQNRQSRHSGTLARTHLLKVAVEWPDKSVSSTTVSVDLH